LDRIERDMDPIEMALFLLRPIPSFLATLRDDPDKTLPMVRAAAAYARLGLPVVPCHPETKTPIPEHGFHDATTDLGKIFDWWRKAPTANIGINLERSGLVIIDIDDPAIKVREDYGGYIPRTHLVESSKGKRHFWYRRPAAVPAIRVTKLFDRGIDILASGLLMVPPSIHPDGSVYRVAELGFEKSISELPAAPDWVVEVLQQTYNGRNVPKSPVRVAPRVDQVSRSELDAEEILAELDGKIGLSILSIIVDGYQLDNPAVERKSGSNQIDRSETDQKVAYALVCAGLSDDEIHAIFETFPIGTDGKYAEKRGNYLPNTIASARNWSCSQSSKRDVARRRSG